MNKEKIVVTIISIIILIGAILFCIYTKDENGSERMNNIEKNIIENEEVSDECTEEYEIASNEFIEKTNSVDEKVSANAILILKKYYKKCEHTINDYLQLPIELVNMTEEEVKKQFPDWDVIGFSSDEIILYKEFEETCKEHFVMKIEDDKIVIYKKLETGELQLYKKTDISIQYLTEVDLDKIKDGEFEIFGREELNKVLEDFE